MRGWLWIAAVMATGGWDFHVAPMQCYTNLHLRLLYRKLGANNVTLWTELEKIPDLWDSSSTGLKKRFGSPQFHADQGKVVLQIGGNVPSRTYDCLKRLCESYHFTEVNLNCGCPSIQSGGNDAYGASLMKQPDLTAQLLRSLKSALPSSTVVSLKCRIAVLETAEDKYDPDSSYRDLCRYIAMAEEAGASHIALHARPVILSGFSSVQNRRIPSLDYGFVENVAAQFPNLKITLNGGITSISELENLRQQYANQIDSFMAGRWMLRRPLDLPFLFHDSNDNNRPDVVSGVQIFLRESAKQSYSMQDIGLPLFLVSEQLREDFDALNSSEGHFQDRQTTQLSEAEMEQIYQVLVHGISQLDPSFVDKLPTKVNFKKLSSSIIAYVGKKVANKWKRNRSEL